MNQKLGSDLIYIGQKYISLSLVKEISFEEGRVVLNLFDNSSYLIPDKKGFSDSLRQRLSVIFKTQEKYCQRKMLTL